MKDVVDIVMDTIGEDAPKPETEYLDEEGLLRCSVCHKRTERIISVPSLGINKKVRCICDCRQKEREAFHERERLEEIERRRRACFAETNMHSWTFKNDDGKNQKISEAMQNYVKDFTEMKKIGKGLLLYGTVGTGKTYFAACIANSLIDQGRKCLMSNFSRMINQISGTFEGKQKFIDGLNYYDLLIIDDLGAERNSDFMQEHVFNIVDARYRSGLPFIITTNLTAEEIKKPQDVGYSRIYDRILERCHPVKVEGVSRRREKLKEEYSEMQKLLGL